MVTDEATKPAMILPANPGLQYQRLKKQIDTAVHRVLQSGWYILGPEVEAFEREFASFCGVRFAVGVASGTDAIRLALWALEIGPGAEVIVPAHTAVATVAAVERTGAAPVLVDIDPQTYTLDPKCVADALTPKTKAIIAVHLYGQIGDMGALLELVQGSDIYLIEDCAQAHGARWREKPAGSIGVVGCFSFYPTKNLGAIGDGGAVVTDHPDVDRRIRLLREYGWVKRNESSIPGDNSRLDELQAAVLRVKLENLEVDTMERRALAAQLTAQLTGFVTPPMELPDRRHVFHLYVIQTDHRDELQRELKRRGIGTGVHYPMPVHCQEAYAHRLGERGGFPHAERVCCRVLSLPLYPGLTTSDVTRIVEAVREAVAAL